MRIKSWENRTAFSGVGKAELLVLGLLFSISIFIGFSDFMVFPFEEEEFSSSSESDSVKTLDLPLLLLEMRCGMI